MYVLDFQFFLKKDILRKLIVVSCLFLSHRSHMIISYMTTGDIKINQDDWIPQCDNTHLPMHTYEYPVRLA